MSQYYETEFKKVVVRLHLEEGRTIKSLSQEYKVSKASISNWVKQFRDECLIDEKAKKNYDFMKETHRLKKELSVVSSITSRERTSGLAIKTLEKASKRQKICKGRLILHSGQGSQYTSMAFTEYCENTGIKQSMSRKGCPYDNAPMERYFNTLKNELINLYYFHTDEELNSAINDFTYVWYNQIRPHAYNNYKTPYDVRYKNN